MCICSICCLQPAIKSWSYCDRITETKILRVYKSSLYIWIQQLITHEGVSHRKMFHVKYTFDILFVLFPFQSSQWSAPFFFYHYYLIIYITRLKFIPKQNNHTYSLIWHICPPYKHQADCLRLWCNMVWKVQIILHNRQSHLNTLSKTKLTEWLKAFQGCGGILSPPWQEHPQGHQRETTTQTPQ